MAEKKYDPIWMVLVIKLSYGSEKFATLQMIEDAYYDDLLSTTFSKKKTLQDKLGIITTEDLTIEELYNVLIDSDATFKSVFSGRSLKSILCCRPDDLPTLIDDLDAKISVIHKEDIDEFNQQLNVLFDYSGKFQGAHITPFFKDNFDFRTCHYCNRTYTTDLELKDENSGKNETVVTYQLDHFYEKSQYPYLGLSFYNFIPCCSTCNTTVKNRAVNYKKDDCHSKKCIAPNREEFDFHEQVQFKTFSADEDFFSCFP